MTDRPSEYVLAIDAGQSNTSCLVGLKDGTLISSGGGGAAAVPDNEGTAPLMRAALSACVNEALAGITPRPERVAAAYLSLTGGASAALDFLPTLVQVERIQAESDSVAALASGAYGGPGVALISGTGSITFAQNASGERVICGGWGYLLGDEGSGFWVGLQAVRAAVRAEDGRGPRSRFIEQVMAQLQVQDMREAQAKIYNGLIPRPDVARLAPTAMRAAEEGDAIARAIVAQAARELFTLVKATCEKAGFTRPEEKVIVATGGVMHPDTPVFREFAALVARELPSYKVVVPRFPPVVGAFILSLILSGARVEEKTLARIEATFPNLPASHLKA